MDSPERRPYVVLSCAMSVDGYIDDSSGTRLVLSNALDLDRVDEVRADVDAILVGAGTIRADDPRLLVRSPARRVERRAQGRPEGPVKVTLTRRADLDPTARFFSTGDVEKLVYCSTAAWADASDRLGAVATVVDAGDPPDLRGVLADLASRGVERLMVEGGSHILTQFLTSGLADELQLAVAPVFVGQGSAPRIVTGGTFPTDRMTVAGVEQVGDVVRIRYLLH